MHAQAHRRFASSRVVAERQKIGLRIATRRRHLPHRFVDPIGRKAHVLRYRIRDVANRSPFRQEYRIHINRGVADIAREDEAGSAIDGNVNDEAALGRNSSHCVEGAFDYLFRQLGRHGGTWEPALTTFSYHASLTSGVKLKIIVLYRAIG
jgi:hypothetical protein